LSPAPRSPTSARSLAPSAKPPRPLSHPTHATSQASPPLTEDRRCSATAVESPSHPWPRRSPPPSTRGSTAPPSSPERSRVRTRGEKPSCALIHLLLSFCPHNSSPELISVVVSPPHRVPRSLVLLRRRGAHGRVCQIALSALELFPKPLQPRHGHPPRLRRDLAVEPSGAALIHKTFPAPISTVRS
jgi:hypothetical protein